MRKPSAQRSAPRAAGAPSAGENDELTIGSDIVVPYKEGAVELEQVWKHVQPEAIKKDWREAPRFRAKLNVNLDEIEDLYMMYERVCYPTDLLEKRVKWLNQRLSGSKADFKQKTTRGELIAFDCMCIALALNPGDPVNAMWRDTPSEGDILRVEVVRYEN